MIRRGFWLAAGAVSGIYGYRRVSALGRRLSASLNPAAPAREARGVSAGSGHRGAITAAREAYRFTRDVREGMDLYTARHSRPAGSTLSTDPGSTNPGSTNHGSTNHGSTTGSTNHEPKDGH